MGKVIVVKNGNWLEPTNVPLAEGRMRRGAFNVVVLVDWGEVVLTYLPQENSPNIFHVLNVCFWGV